MDTLGEILIKKEPEWMAKKKEFCKVVELVLMEVIRRGMSYHLSGASPCSTNDYAKIITLCHYSLGKYPR